MPTYLPISRLGGKSEIVEPSSPINMERFINVEEKYKQIAMAFQARKRSTPVVHYSIEDVMIDHRFEYLWWRDMFIEEFRYGPVHPNFHNMRTIPEVLIEDDDLRPVLIGNNWCFGNYYHWLAQCVPTIFSLIGSHGRENVRLALPSLNQWQEDSLRLLGFSDIPRIHILPYKQYRFKSVMFSSIRSGFSDCYAGFSSYSNAFLRAAPPSRRRGKMIYVARLDATVRKIKNEDKIASVMAKKGFEIVNAGEHTLEEQIDIFRSADVVVGPHGAGLTNTMFCSPGTFVYEFMARQYFSHCMNAISQSLGHIYFADFFDDPDASQTDDWSADIDAIESKVDHILECLNARS